MSQQAIRENKSYRGTQKYSMVNLLTYLRVTPRIPRLRPPVKSKNLVYEKSLRVISRSGDLSPFTNSPSFVGNWNNKMSSLI